MNNKVIIKAARVTPPLRILYISELVHEKSETRSRVALSDGDTASCVSRIWQLKKDSGVICISNNQEKININGLYGRAKPWLLNII